MTPNTTQDIVQVYHADSDFQVPCC